MGGNTLEMRLWGCHRYSTIKVGETGELYLGTGDRGGVLQLAYLLSWQESQSILSIGLSILAIFWHESFR